MLKTLLDMRHHIVQEQYLRQWCKNTFDCQLWIYTHSDGKFFQRGPSWKGFWREDFNIYEEEGEEDAYYLPEEVTSQIDNAGMTAIRNITFSKQLDGYQRSSLAFYAVLQYVRTPKFRENTNSMIDAQTKHFMRLDIPTPEDVRMTRDDILKEKPKNDMEREAIEKVKNMTDEEFKQTLFDTIHGDDVHVRLTNAGHSKQILKVERNAQKVFEFAWTIMFAPQDTSFITSDAPCFAFAYKNTAMGAGLCSPNAVTIFPLSPSFCLMIDPSIKGQHEQFTKISKSGVRAINQQILKHSHDCVVAYDEIHLKRLVKNYQHEKGREVSVKTIGPYTLFS